MPIVEELRTCEDLEDLNDDYGLNNTVQLPEAHVIRALKRKTKDRSATIEKTSYMKYLAKQSYFDKKM